MTPPKLQEAMADEIEVLQAELSSLAYAVSHDLAAPVRASASFSDLLSRRLDDHQDPKVRMYIQQIQNASNRLHAMLDAMAQYSRAVSDSFEVQDIDLRVLVPSVVQRKPVWCDAVAIQLLGAAKVVASSKHVDFILSSLLDNAHKFGAGGAIEVSAADSDPFVQIVVCNRAGPNILARDAQRIFELFQRLHTQSEYEGLGMGLSLARRLARRNGGDLRTEPCRQGARFVLCLPACALPASV